MEYWTKFHSIYEETISKGLITKDDESRFLETKAIIKEKYASLKNSLDFKYAPHGRLTDPVDEILAFDNIRLMSEETVRAMGNNWKDSYVFLNSILERLESNKRRLEEFSTVGVFFKKIFDRR
jgi:hypothetical protein